MKALWVGGFAETVLTWLKSSHGSCRVEEGKSDTGHQVPRYHAEEGPTFGDGAGWRFNLCSVLAAALPPPSLVFLQATPNI